MPLTIVELIEPPQPSPHPQLPAFLAEARARVDAFQESTRVDGFVSCDFEPVEAAIRAIRQMNLAPGNVFCEWGSGLGIVASLAGFAGFESWGIEVDESLVISARQLAADFDAPVKFVDGSFIPHGAEDIIDLAIPSDVCWLNTEADPAYTRMDLEPDDFDVIFAYPWPGEESVIQSLFEFTAATGALLATYSYLDGVRVMRKV